MHVIGTAGHVDHGKSALVERLTGIDPDRFAEEKARGLTIDLGFAWMELPSGNEVGIVDVPGHERFIKNMLAGAGGITVCLFVVAANEGWMPQSSEHLAIIDILGIGTSVIALTKSDTVDAATLDRVAADVRTRVSGTVLEGATVVSCSVVSGDGMDPLVAELDRAVRSAVPAPDHDQPRLWVDRVFTIAGAGTVVTGTLAGGSFSVGDSIEISPDGRRARIRTIQSHKKEVRAIAPGNRTALNLAALEREGAARGDAIVRPGQFRPTRRVDVRLRITGIEQAAGGHGLTDKGAHLLYVGSAEVPARVKLLGTDRLDPGHEGFAQLSLTQPLPLKRGDRFVLRDAGRVITLGGGVVLDPLPTAARKTDADRVSLLESLTQSDDRGALTALLDAYSQMNRDEALFRSGAELPVPGVHELGELLVSDAELVRLMDLVRDTLALHHAQNPLDKGMGRQQLRAATGLPGSAFDTLMDTMDDIDQAAAIVRLTSHRVELDPVQEAARKELMDTIGAGGFAPPLTKDLSTDQTLLRSLVESQELVRVGDFHITRGQADEARTRVRQRIETEGPATVAEIRDLLGTTRKYAVPLCEWLDSTGATRRQGDLRALGPNP